MTTGGHCYGGTGGGSFHDNNSLVGNNNNGDGGGDKGSDCGGDDDKESDLGELGCDLAGEDVLANGYSSSCIIHRFLPGPVRLMTGLGCWEGRVVWACTAEVNGDDWAEPGGRCVLMPEEEAATFARWAAVADAPCA